MKCPFKTITITENLRKANSDLPNTVTETIDFGECDKEGCAAWQWTATVQNGGDTTRLCVRIKNGA